MILEASRAGVDCVKFQKSYLNEKFTRNALIRPYKSEHSFGSSYGEHKKFLEFSIEQFRELKKYAESLGLIFSSSAMDRVSKYIFYLRKFHLPFSQFSTITI
jgi:sialic acid synthase